MADTWKAPSHAAGTSLGYAADMLAGKPVFGVVDDDVADDARTRC